MDKWIKLFKIWENNKNNTFKTCNNKNSITCIEIYIFTIKKNV